MAIEEPGLKSLQGTPNYYRCMFLLFLCLFAAVVLFMIGANFCLAYQHKGIEGDILALSGELTAIGDDMAADGNEMKSLDEEEMSLAKSEQIFSEGMDPASVWRADARWSEMGKARVNEIWNRRQWLRDRLTGLQALQREKTAQLMTIQAEEQQITYLRDTLKKQRFTLYGILLFSGFGMVLFGLLWHALFQKRVNRILQTMAHE